MGNYEAYLYSMNQEIEQGERVAQQKGAEGKDPVSAQPVKAVQKLNRKQQREIKKVEQKIASLETEKKSLNKQLLETTDASEALKLHARFTEVTDELGRFEERWLQLTEG